MDELETFEDIVSYEKEQWNDYHSKKAIGRVSELIRQEAIKWIKDCFMCNTTPRKRPGCRACVKFKRFFNITEEDLK